MRYYNNSLSSLSVRVWYNISKARCRAIREGNADNRGRGGGIYSGFLSVQIGTVLRCYVWNIQCSRSALPNDKKQSCSGDACLKHKDSYV